MHPPGPLRRSVERSMDAGTTGLERKLEDGGGPAPAIALGLSHSPPRRIDRSPRAGSERPSRSRSPLATPTPVLRQECPSLVVAPATGNLQVPSREAFAPKSNTANQGSRGLVARLDIRLDAMKAQAPESPAERQREALGHVAPTGMRHERVVAEVRAAKRPAHDLADVDHSGEVSGLPEHDESPFMAGLRQAPDVRTVRRPRGGRWRPSAEKRLAASSGLEELPLVSRRRLPQLNARPDGNLRRQGGQRISPLAAFLADATRYGRSENVGISQQECP